MGKFVAILTVVIIFLVMVVAGRDFFLPSRTGGNSTDVQDKTLAEGNRVAVTHAWKDGMHRYTGTFLLPHSCFVVDQSGSFQNGKITIMFDVEDRIATEKTCINITTRYPFTVLVEAPKDMLPIFFLNDEEVPAKIRELEWQSAAGTLVEPSVSSPEVFQ
jgi:hypothetical protein